MSDTTDVLPTERLGADTAQGAAPAISGESPTTESPTAKPRRRTAGLSGMVLPELQKMAVGLGISTTGRMRKGDLIAAIQSAQDGGRRAPATNGSRAVETASAADQLTPTQAAPAAAVASTPAPVERPAVAERSDADAAPARRSRRAAGRPAGAPDASGASETANPEQAGERQPARQQDDGRPDGRGERPVDRQNGDRQNGDRQRSGRQGSDRQGSDRQQTEARATELDPSNGDRPKGDRQGNRQGNDRQGNDRQGNDRQGSDRQGSDRQGARQNQGSNGGHTNHDDEGGEGGRRRGRRFRDRNRRGGNANRERFGNEAEPEVREDDVLIPVAGIIDILDNYAFVRTSGYLPGPDDVYVSMNQLRKNGLRRGDAVTGAVRQPREGERHDKFNALVRLDTVNGVAPDEANKRPEFFKLTPLYPQERLRLETESNILTTRIIDLVVPIGKGQRALIVSPPKAGKTMVLQAIANAITTNNPECHLMVVLVDERPEEVTDMQRSVKGEVIASTFDRPPSDHTTVAELSIERAKRLVELGHDVVVLLDSITRLGRAYNNASPASGRILSGGIDSTALYPPKRFLGAARNIENGGSLTILSTALVETGSTGDTVIYEEFKGTGNAELYLDRKLANRRIFPAVDVVASGTRKEEILMSPEEQVVVNKLRRVLHSLEPQAALELLLERLKKTTNNIEFLMQIQKTTLGSDE